MSIVPIVMIVTPVMLGLLVVYATPFGDWLRSLPEMDPW